MTSVMRLFTPPAHRRNAMPAGDLRGEGEPRAEDRPAETFTR
ncbi:MAG: hypothetical protein SFX73_27965 [Kofleriaceae bacterium]|nr:hypothetical protein [Kofleriaceae bacterium]